MNAQETQIKTETAQSDPHLKARLPEMVWLPRGDYALGLRMQLRHSLDWPDYARGSRTLPREMEGPDYARGLRLLSRAVVEGPDFARGLRHN